jgi:hypothetical protein
MGRGSEKTRSGKQVIGANEGSSLHLYAPENAVNRPTVLILLEHGTPTIRAEIGVQRYLILDTTGSNILILQPGISRSDLRCTSIKPYGVTGETLEIRGQQTVSFVVDEHEFKHSFYVCSLPIKAAGLLGMVLWENRRQNRFRKGQVVACSYFKRAEKC